MKGQTFAGPRIGRGTAGFLVILVVVRNNIARGNTFSEMQP